MPFQFAIYYLYDKSLKVESTSILVANIDQHSQVTSKPDLDGDDNWLEIKWPTRKEPEKTVPAKVLLFGGLFFYFYFFLKLHFQVLYCAIVQLFWWQVYVRLKCFCACYIRFVQRPRHEEKLTTFGKGHMEQGWKQGCSFQKENVGHQQRGGG